jgi:DivIVA domain-containing protein
VPFPFSEHPLTAGQVRQIRFPRPARGLPGYDQDQVDAFLRRISDALAHRGHLHPDEVRSVVFRTAPGGYDQRAVDDLLGRVERQLRVGLLAPTSLRSGADLLAVKLPRSTGGYDRGEVDAFLTRAASNLDGRGTMRANEVRNTRFSTTTGLKRGYRVRAVDDLLDELEQELRFRGR